MIKYSIRSELTRKYYERRLRKFFDFIQFGIGFMLLRLVTQYKNTMNYSHKVNIIIRDINKIHHIRINDYLITCE